MGTFCLRCDSKLHKPRSWNMSASNVAHNHRFGAYAASKAALNQMLRHMAAELKRKGAQTTILAMHPGEVLTYVPSSRTCRLTSSPRTPQNSYTINVTQIADSCLEYSDMTNIDADLPIEGLITPQESVEKMLAVIPKKTIDDTGTFWTWEGNVSTEPFHFTSWFCT